MATKDLLLSANVAAKNRPSLVESVWGDDAAFRLHEPDPELVVLDDRVDCHGYLVLPLFASAMASMRWRARITAS